MNFGVLPLYAPFILILGGIVALSWVLEEIVKFVPLVGKMLSLIFKLLSFFSFFVGILMIVTAITTWLITVVELDTGTQYLLIVAGLTLSLRPIKNIPLAALLGIAAGGFCAGFIFVFYPLPETIYNISSFWVYLLVFFIPAVFVYVIFKFIEDVLKLVTMILTFKPVKFVLGGICIAQGVVMLLFNTSVFSFFV